MSSIEKQLTNVQRHYQTNIMELTLLPHLTMASILKSKVLLVTTDRNCS